jgi:hypothetical protein
MSVIGRSYRSLRQVETPLTKAARVEYADDLPDYQPDQRDGPESKPVAVARRRFARRARSEGRRAKDAERRKREHDVAVRMVGRFFGGSVVHLILLDYRYWLARRCGWNPLAPQWRLSGLKTADGRDVLCHPQESRIWQWWTRLHWKHRQELARMTPHGLRRTLNGLPSPTYLLIQKDLAVA